VYLSFGGIVNSEIGKWGKVIEAAGIEPGTKAGVNAWRRPAFDWDRLINHEREKANE
jgi:hypothetical protein